MLDSLVRVVWEDQDGGPKRLRTSGLASFVAKFGEDLLIQYCRCYVHADRLESLVSMLHWALKNQSGVAAIRIYLTFQAFAVGTLFEATASINALAKALKEAGIFEKKEWEEGLGKWIAWSKDRPWVEYVRKKAAFHVDADWVREGLRAFSDEPFTVMTWDSRKARDSYMPLAHSAMLAGAHLAKSDFLDAMSAEKELGLVRLKDALGKSFLKTLDRRGLKPILLKSNRVPSYQEEVREIRSRTEEKG